MKFSCTVDINLPRKKVIELWDNEEHLGQWQTGFLNFQQLSGEKGKDGAKAIMTYDFRGRPMEIQETILANNLPDSFSGKYEHKHMDNTMYNSFVALDANTTRWQADVEYVQFKAFVPKMMAKLFPGMFRKQTQTWLDQFKAFAEGEKDLG